jgi:hypothetical protein
MQYFCDNVAGERKKSSKTVLPNKPSKMSFKTQKWNTRT